MPTYKFPFLVYEPESGCPHMKDMTTVRHTALYYAIEVSCPRYCEHSNNKTEIYWRKDKCSKP